MHYTIIDPMAVDAMWPVVGPWAIQAIGEEAAFMDVEWIRDNCKRGVCVIWIAHKREEFDPRDIEAVLICERAFYCGIPTLIMRWLSGRSESASWQEHIAFIEIWAEHNGFRRTEIWGRKGWERVFKQAGYALDSIHLSKFLRRSIN